jgi:hypothetical protein
MSNYKMKPSDLLFYQEGGVTKSLGFEINNKYLNKMPAIIQKGGKKEKDTPYAVPAGLYLMHQKLNMMIGGSGHFEDTTIIDEGGGHESVDDSLYSRLLELSGPTTKQTRGGSKKKKTHKTHKTRKKRKAKTRTTRKK